MKGNVEKGKGFSAKDTDLGGNYRAVAGPQSEKAGGPGNNRGKKKMGRRGGEKKNLRLKCPKFSGGGKKNKATRCSPKRSQKREMKGGK